MIIKPKAYNINIVLFRDCNFRCNFCYQNGMSPGINKKYIKSIYNKLRQTILSDQGIEWLRKQNFEYIHVGFSGGEIFRDETPDWVYYEIINIYDNIKKRVKEVLGLPVKFFFMSNGYLPLEDDRYISWLDWFSDVDVSVEFSYDRSGRFTTEEQRQKVLANIRRFHSAGYLRSVTITLTKDNVQDIDYLLDIPKDISINTSYYYPLNNHIPVPTNEELFNFFKMAYDNDINIDTLRNIKKGLVEEYCQPAILLLPGMKEIPYEFDYCGQFSVIKTLYKGDIRDYFNRYDEIISRKSSEDLGKELMGCMYCEYADNCPKFCFLEAMQKQYDISSECFFKKLIPYIERKK